MEERDLAKQPLSAAELEALIGERDYREFLNPKNELYRTMNMKTNRPSRARAIEMMMKEPNLIRRPILVRGKEVVLGFDEKRYSELAKERTPAAGRPPANRFQGHSAVNKQVIRLRINGQAHDLAICPNRSLLEVLREELSLTGTKCGCD